MTDKKLSIEDMAIFCKKKGLVFQSGEIYGGLSGFFDFGPDCVEIKNNIKREWWKFHVQERDDIVGIDGSIITNPKVWEASGHVANFNDVYVKCKKCKKPNKIDKSEIGKAKCDCGGEYEIIGDINLMFKTNVGPVEGNAAYLRPETAQLIFANFKLVAESSRLKLPFGIAQIGKAFRNEISPRDFLFRSREFEQMEIEYFVHQNNAKKCPFIKDVLKHEINIFSEEMQKKNKKPEKMTIEQAIKNKIINTEWLAYWLATEHKWFINLGANPENFRIRQHVKDELAHYSSDCWDLEYKFPFGWKELEGMADRSDFDLKQHIKYSKKDLSIFDQETNKKIVPYVAAEPSLGIERAFLVFMFDAYNDDKKRGNIVLKLDPKIAPIKAGIFPLVNKPELENLAKEIKGNLKNYFNVKYDRSGSIGRRYARADEIGTPYCITVDFDSLKDKTVTIRDRNTTNQARIKISELRNTIEQLIQKEISFSEIK
jgi:glycyl-tRNA synthetase